MLTHSHPSTHPIDHPDRTHLLGERARPHAVAASADDRRSLYPTLGGPDPDAQNGMYACISVGPASESPDSPHLLESYYELTVGGPGAHLTMLHRRDADSDVAVDVDFHDFDMCCCCYRCR